MEFPLMMSTVLTPLFGTPKFSSQVTLPPVTLFLHPVQYPSPICIFVEAYAFDHVFPEASNE
jgi:hypothetical protein